MTLESVEQFHVVDASDLLAVLAFQAEDSNSILARIAHVGESIIVQLLVCVVE